ncbi:MAG: SPOR domain-containing protein [Syntrophaceae bacterium]|nr:SPOR domain-containing protein [Syntrophaceae bacterium]
MAATRGVETAVAPPKKTAEPAKGAGTAKESFILQVASYKEKVKAEETAKKLGSMGFRPRIQAVDLPAKGRWFRIVVGGFESRDAAQKAADKISKKLKGINCIVRKV